MSTDRPATPDLPPGFYWVRDKYGGEPLIAEWCESNSGTFAWARAGVGLALPRDVYEPASPRLTEPDSCLPELPPHWHIAKIEVRRDRAWMYRQGDLTYDALLERDGGDYEATGSGPTPAAAMRAALQETR